jgi:shikimate kinase
VKKHLVLIGLPGAGKSTVGRLVAERLQTSFVDIDSILIRKEGKPITMIFAERASRRFATWSAGSGVRAHSSRR